MAWVALGIVAVIKFNLDYLLVVGVALVLSIANIIGFTKCRKGSPALCFCISPTLDLPYFNTRCLAIQVYQSFWFRSVDYRARDTWLLSVMLFSSEILH